MLNFNFFMPTKIIHGKDTVRENAQQFKDLGKSALIVSGKHSARLSGALDDVEYVLKQQNITFSHLDNVENNPSLENVTAGANHAKELKPDYIIAIGGGSPLDAAKAIAMLTTNNISALDLFKGIFPNKPLPLIAIPTTSGTGSEVTPYSVLTVPDKQTKQGFGSPSLFPAIAFLDCRYSMSLPEAITIDTAVDALSHLVEGYFTKRANSASDMLAERGICLFAECIQALREKDFSEEMRDKLLIASALGGMTITHTATSFVHALGYPLTYFHGIPHGQANGILMGEYLLLNASIDNLRVKNVLSWLGLADIDQFRALMNEFFPDRIKLSPGEISRFAEGAMSTRNVSNSIGEITVSVLSEVLRKSLT